MCGSEAKYPKTRKLARARSYGHVAGAREAGASADVKRVPELLSPEAAKAANYKLDQTAPVARIDDLAGTTRSS